LNEDESGRAGALDRPINSADARLYLANSTDFGIAAVALAPFAAALLAPALVRRLGRLAPPLLALLPAVSFAWLATLIPPIAAGAPVEARLPWVPDYGLDLSFRLDGLSLTFALLVAGIGTLIVLYAGAYLRGHPHHGRFLGFLLAFMGAMQGLVLADNVVVLYGFWELTTLTSFLLIGFDHTRQAARRAAVQALVLTNAGGLALLLGALVLQYLTGTWELSGMAGQGASITAGPAYPLVLACFVLAAFTKSAQLPFQFWLPNAMEAPTPVSAYLHSATMVQAGVYLIARMSPVLGGTPAWTLILAVFGGATLLWGALAALRQTDLKQMLAHSTIASLGLTVLLLGLGGEAGAVAAIAYFVAHALYKAGFFLVAGLIDHETGLRDITALGGLRDPMAASFIAAILAGFSMLGLPPALGYLAKEAIYAGAGVNWPSLVAMLALVAGNAALGAVAVALVARPFMGPLPPTPKTPHEGPVAMLVGPLVLGIGGIAAAVLSSWTADSLIGPAAAAVVGGPASVHLGFVPDLAGPALWLSLVTWALSALLFWRLDASRTVLRRVAAARGWSFDRSYDFLMEGLVRTAGRFWSAWQNGRLRFYLGVIFVVTASGLLLPLLALGGLPRLPSLAALRPLEWGLIALALAGLVVVLAARTLLVGILALGVQGLAVALIYLDFGAPDLSFTQFMVETLSVVMFALVMVRLRLDRHQRRPRGVAMRDAALAVLCGGAVALTLLRILEAPLDTRLSTFFEQNAAALAHGRNIVNVILVDFRALDTLGEISVVMTAGIAILALVAGGRAAGPLLRRLTQADEPATESEASS
jgi:multicomponent Na+:H+ antiporter subunit A